MQNAIFQAEQRQKRSKIRSHWGVLAGADPDKIKVKRGNFITQLNGQLRNMKEWGKDKSDPQSEDFSI